MKCEVKAPDPLPAVSGRCRPHRRARDADRLPRGICRVKSSTIAPLSHGETRRDTRMTYKLVITWPRTERTMSELHGRYRIYDITILESARLLTTKTMTRVIFCLTGVGKTSIACFVSFFLFLFYSIFSSLFFFPANLALATRAGNWTDTVCNMADREPNTSAGMGDISRCSPKFRRCVMKEIRARENIGQFLRRNDREGN